MTKKLWIVWALCLMLPGGLGLGIYVQRESTFHLQIDLAREADSKDSTVRDYIRMYEKWSALDPELKADNPWGYGDYGGADIRKQLQAGQADRLLLDSAQLSKGVNHYPGPLADVIYGSGWENKVDEYERNRTYSEILLSASIFLAATGGLFIVGGLIKIVIVSMIRKKQQDPEPPETVIENDSDKSIDFEENVIDPLANADSPVEPVSEGRLEEQIDIEDPEEGYFGGRKKNINPVSSNSAVTGTSSLSPTISPSATQSLLETSTKDSYFGWAVDEHDTPALEKLMTSEPMTRDLSVLTEEVSAIREFAAQQQDQVRKLQDGYDWMIIRRFCQRIIRCIDNIDDRFISLQQEGHDAADYLEDIRDELIFSLESSGVEQYSPDLNTPFKGLEKYVEAVRERVVTNDETLVGAIAEVIRPGYQYLVSDDDVKIIRCAQVKLFGTDNTS